MPAGTGYISGSDLLVFVEGQAIGHCSTCTITNGTETKERAVKPPAADTAANVGKWTEKNVSKLTVQITAEGFSFYNEDECGYSDLLDLWAAAAPVTCKYAHRGEEATVYRQGEFVISNLQETSPAGDDATYSLTLENSGPVTKYPAA
jgi:hypothetical protein